MIAFLDVNTIWRRKFADALHRRNRTTVLVSPRALNAPSKAEEGDLAVTLPPGWAGATAVVAMPLLRYRLHQTARARGTPLQAIVLTTPHYLELARREAGQNAIIYYCSDDYRSYDQWDAARMERDEATLCRLATLSIFVSEALRQRAVTEYGLDVTKTRVSPNATEPRFASIPQPPKSLAELPRPIFGTAGMISNRIDLAFLNAVAADPRVGSLALIGPVDLELEGDPTLDRLRTNSKVHFFGAQMHADMPSFMAAFDVAVIPYAATRFNYFCSPMRLYDHLAIGQPIIATTHCDQIAGRDDVLTGGISEIPSLISAALVCAAGGRRQKLETWDNRIASLQKSEVAGFEFGF